MLIMLSNRNDDYRYEDMVELRMKGLTYREIAAVYKISRQRVQYLLLPPPVIRNIVLKRAEGRCEACSIELQHGHFHHVKQQEIYNEPSNLQYLCMGCHRRAHILPRTKRVEISKPARICPCGEEFTPKSKRQTYCDNRCKNREAQRRFRAKIQSSAGQKSGS